MAIKGIKRRLGFRGESAAVKYLKKQGYKIEARNFRCPYGEVDIIAGKGEYLAFIEVKTRTGDSFGRPNEAVRSDRQRRYINCARFYFAGRTIDRIVRFDIIEVMHGSINHIENAFTV